MPIWQPQTAATSGARRQNTGSDSTVPTPRAWPRKVTWPASREGRSGAARKTRSAITRLMAARATNSDLHPQWAATTSAGMVAKMSPTAPTAMTEALARG